MAFRRVIISGEKINDTKADLESFFTTRVFQTNYPGLKHKIIVSPFKEDTLIIDVNGDGADTVSKKIKDLGLKYKMKVMIKVEKPMSAVNETKLTNIIKDILKK